MSSGDNICKQFWVQIRPDKICRAWSGTKQFDTIISMMLFMKEIFEKVDFEKKIQRTARKHVKLTSMQSLIKGEIDRMLVCHTFRYLT